MDRVGFVSVVLGFNSELGKSFVMDRHGEVVGLNSAVENPPYFVKCGGGVALFYWGW